MATEQPSMATTAEAENRPKGVSEGETVVNSRGETATVSNSEATKLNGQTEHTTNEAPTESTDARKASADTEMKDAGKAGEAADSASAPAMPPNGTPAAAKRASIGGSSKKKSSAVPEHKSKKLNKKKSRPMTNLDAQPGDYFFARMKGHPPWPSIVCDEDMLPNSLLSTRPVTAKLPDGSFKKAEYADGGKRAYERTFPVMFLHTNEFAWIPNTELTPLDTDAETTKNPPEKGKSKLLLAAFEKASEANDLDHFKTMLQEHQKALMEDQAEKEERAAKKAKKAARKSSDAAALDDADEMDVDEEDSAAKPKSKKRKKAADESEVEEKASKTPKRLVVTQPKPPATAESSSKKKASKPKAKAAKSGSDEDATTPKVDEKPLSPAVAKEIKEKKVLYFRHKLQRGFLSRDTVPKEEEMKSMSEFLSELETYPDLEGSIIRATKIHKVLKQIIKLQFIPLEESFKFKPRSQGLLDKWNDILATDAPAGGEKADDKADDKSDEKMDDKPEDKPTEKSAKPKPTAPAASTNGDLPPSKEIEKAQQGTAPAPEDVSAKDLETKIGTTTEGEKEAEGSKTAGAAEAKAQEPEKTAEEKATDAPAVNSKPEAEYKPPQVEEGVVESTA